MFSAMGIIFDILFSNTVSKKLFHSSLHCNNSTTDFSGSKSRITPLPIIIAMLNFFSDESKQQVIWSEGAVNSKLKVIICEEVSVAMIWIIKLIVMGILLLMEFPFLISIN